MKNSHMKNHGLNRRQFIRTSAALAGTALLSPWALSGVRAAAAPAGKRTAVDQVTLGRTGIKLSRLGFGTGSDNGHIQAALGQEDFNKLIHYAYDQGITYFDTSETYATFPWIGGAIKGLPRGLHAGFLPVRCEAQTGLPRAIGWQPSEKRRSRHGQRLEGGNRRRAGRTRGELRATAQHRLQHQVEAGERSRILSSANATAVSPAAPVLRSSLSSRPASSSLTSSATSQAAISSSVAPWKFSSQMPSGSAPQRIGGPKVRQVTGRAAYKSQPPVSGSSTGQASSSPWSPRAAASRERSITRPARAGSVRSNSASPSRRRTPSSWVMGNGPMQHSVQPSRQTSHGPLLRADSAIAASRIWMKARSPGMLRG